MNHNLCPKCGSTDIIGDVEVRDYDASSYRRLSVYVAVKNAGGGLFKKTTESGELRASVCGGCGYTEFYTTNFEAMLRATR